MALGGLRRRDQVTYALAAVVVVILVGYNLVEYFTRSTPSGPALVAARETAGGICDYTPGKDSQFLPGLACDQSRAYVFADDHYTVTTLHGTTFTGQWTGQLTSAQREQLASATQNPSFPKLSSTGCPSWITTPEVTFTVVDTSGTKHVFNSCDYSFPSSNPLVELFAQLQIPPNG